MNEQKCDTGHCQLFYKVTTKSRKERLEVTSATHKAVSIAETYDSYTKSDLRKSEN